MSLKKMISDEQVKEASARAGIHEDDLKKHLNSLDIATLHSTLSHPVVTDAGGNCKNVDFDIKIFSVKGKVCFTPGSNWSLLIDLKLYLAGIEVAHVKYELNARNSSVCYHYDILIGSLKVCFGVKTNSGKTCLYTSGTACAFGQCTNWDQNIVCF